MTPDPGREQGMRTAPEQQRFCATSFDLQQRHTFARSLKGVSRDSNFDLTRRRKKLSNEACQGSNKKALIPEGLFLPHDRLQLLRLLVACGRVCRLNDAMVLFHPLHLPGLYLVVLRFLVIVEKCPYFR